MALTKAQAQSLLAGIVGSTGSATRYLGLSTTKPLPEFTGTYEGTQFTNYHISEPTTYDDGGETKATSYARVQLGSGYFPSTVVASGGYDDYKVSILNNKEIHFPEALQSWTQILPIKYFFISTSATAGSAPEGTILYVGELADFIPTSQVQPEPIVVDETYYNEHYSELYTFTNNESTGPEYTQCVAGGYNAEATYYVKGNGINVDANTVPLIRSKYLKISVK